jgi:hypothetical protein
LLESSIVNQFGGTFLRPFGRKIGTRAIDIPIQVDLNNGRVQTAFASPYWFSLSVRSRISGKRRANAERILGTTHDLPTTGLHEPALGPPLLPGMASHTVAPIFPRLALLQVAAEKNLFVIAALSCLCALLFRGGLLLHALGLAVAGPNGSEAGRFRVFLRTVLAWSLAFLMHYLIYRTDVGPWPVYFLLTLLAIGIFWGMLHPSRGVQDYIAGTWLVPR